MGLDLLDFQFRIERSFGIKVKRADLDHLPRRDPWDATAGELHDWVLRLCAERGAKVPSSSWHRVQKVLCDVTGKSPKLIRPETFVVRDLDFST